MQSNPRHVWRNANLLKVLIGETISDLGSQVGDLALPLLAVLSLGVTPAQMAVLLSADYIPRVVVGLLATGGGRCSFPPTSSVRRCSQRWRLLQPVAC